MFPTEFDLWLRMEKVVIRVETVTDLMSNFWIIHFKYLLPRMVTGHGVRGRLKASGLKRWMD